MIFGMLKPEKIWHEHFTDLSTSPVRCSHVALCLRKFKSHLSTLLFIYFRLFTLPWKKTNGNCCTAALAVYLLVFSASCYLHSISTVSGACYRRSTCIDMDMFSLAAVACRIMGWISVYSVVYYATDQCRKTLEVCINAEGSHSEHLLWSCLPDNPVATHHNRFFSEPPMTTHSWLSSEPPTFERTQQTFSLMKTFCSSQVSVVTFSGGVGKWITVCFLRR